MDKLWRKLTKSDKKSKSSTKKLQKETSSKRSTVGDTSVFLTSSPKTSISISALEKHLTNSPRMDSSRSKAVTLSPEKMENYTRKTDVYSGMKNPHFEPLRRAPIYSQQLITDLAQAYSVSKLPNEVLQILTKSYVEEEDIYDNFYTFLTCLYYTSPKKLLKRPRMKGPPKKSFEYKYQCDSLTELTSETDSFSTRLLEIPLNLPKDPKDTLPSSMVTSEYSSSNSLDQNFQLSCISVDEMKMFGRHYQTKKCGSRSKRRHFSKTEINLLLSTKNPHNIYTNFKEIGKGSYGKVFSAVDKQDKSLKAIKKMNRSLKDDCDNILNEIYLLKSFNHPNITSFVNTFHWDEHIWIVMELADAGTLKDALVVELKEKNIRHVLRELVAGIKYMHDNKQIHRDLKSSNILLKSDGRIQIADFGLCVPRNKNGLTGMAGSKYWMAPEMILRIPYFEKVDIWSLGAVGIELLTGKPPYNSFKPVKALFVTATKGISLFEFQNKYSKDLLDFLQKCFVRNPDKRASADDLYHHKFLAGNAYNDQVDFCKLIKCLQKN